MFYRYDFDGKFTGKTTGQKNPKEGGFLQPANSTHIPIPNDYSINEWPIFNLETQIWELVESDYKKAMDSQNLEELIDGVHTYKLVESVVVEKSTAEFEAELLIFQEAEAVKEAETAANKYKKDRKAEYETRNLTFDRFVEMLIEDDTEGIAAFRSERLVVKDLIKKPIAWA